MKLNISLYKAADDTYASSMTSYGNADITIPTEVSGAAIKHVHVSLTVSSGANISSAAVTVSNISIIQLPEEDEEIMRDITYTRDSAGRQLISKKPSDTWAPNPNPSHLGTTFTWNADGTCTVSGSNGSYAASAQLFTAWGASVMPPAMQKGGRYYVDYETTDPKIRLYILIYKSNSTSNPYQYMFTAPGVLEIPNDDNITGMSIRLRCEPGFVSGTIKRLNIYTSDKMDVIKAATVAGTAMKLRVMQYNAGMFNNGTKDPYGIPAANYAGVLANYRKLLCEVQPDIVAIEEYPQNIDREHTTTPKAALFDPLGYNDHVVTSIERGVFGHLPIANKANGTITADQTRYYTLTEFTLPNGQRLGVMCTALWYEIGDDAVTERAAELPLLLAKMDGYDYAIIALDMNNGGDDDSDASQSAVEGASLLAIAKAAGWNFAMGNYYPWETTYNDSGSANPRPTWTPMLDNIIYKDNGKIRFRGFKVLPDVDSASNRLLYSDHYPVYGDFDILL